MAMAAPRVPARCRLAKKNAVVCTKCGRVDLSEWRFLEDGHMELHVGTGKKMMCPSCANTEGFASLCRDCCPTRHQIEVSIAEVVEAFKTILATNKDTSDVGGKLPEALTEALQQDLKANRLLTLWEWTDESIEDMLYAPLTPATQENTFNRWPNVCKVVSEVLYKENLRQLDEFLDGPKSEA